MSNPTQEAVRCPKCGSLDVRYSYSQTTWDTIIETLFSMEAFRCRSCRRRFHKFDPAGDDEERPREEPPEERPRNRESRGEK